MPFEFDHVVLTNFSAPSATGTPAADPELLWYRLGFFFDACLPSLASQQGADFTWLVWFDDRCDEEFRDEVARIAGDDFVPVWGSTFDATSVAGVVAPLTRSTHLITTLINFDDAMAKDCLATVVAESGRQNDLLVEFPNGFMIDRTGGVFIAHDDSGPVRSFIEMRSADTLPRTVVGVPHDDAVPRRTITTPMWIDVVHEPGRAELITSRRVAPPRVNDRFDIDLTYDRGLSGARLRHARMGDLRRRGRNLMRDPKKGAVVKPALRSVRAASWMARSVVNTAVDLNERRRSTAGLRVVAGDPESLITGERIAVVAEFSNDSRIRAWALTMSEALAAAGYPCLIVCSREGGRRVSAPDSLSSNIAVLSRANVKYDFGAWAAALSAFPSIAQTAHVLLTNDSIVGPLPPESPGLRTTLDRAESSGSQVWSATRGYTGGTHMQSYFLTFHDGALELPPVRDFFGTLRHTTDRVDLVRTYEHGLTQTLANEAIHTGWGWDPASFGFDSWTNPSYCWRELLAAGFPFVKRRLLTHPRFVDERAAIIAYAREQHGLDLSSGL